MAIRTIERQAALRCLSTPSTLNDVVTRTGLDYARARHALGYFVRAKLATYTTERRAHCRRPVAVYVAAPPEAAKAPEPVEAQPGVTWLDLTQAWR
jgi:hypothetical protein